MVLGAIVPDILKPGELADNTLPNKYQYIVMDGRTVLCSLGRHPGPVILKVELHHFASSPATAGESAVSSRK